MAVAAAGLAAAAAAAVTVAAPSQRLLGLLRRPGRGTSIIDSESLDIRRRAQAAAQPGSQRSAGQRHVVLRHSAQAG
jgi:hypothetical protein